MLAGLSSPAQAWPARTSNSSQAGPRYWESQVFILWVKPVHVTVVSSASPAVPRLWNASRFSIDREHPRVGTDAEFATQSSIAAHRDQTRDPGRTRFARV